MLNNEDGQNKRVSGQKREWQIVKVCNRPVSKACEYYISKVNAV